METKRESGRKLDVLLLGRIAIDFNPVDYPKPLSQCGTFRKYVGGSPANIAVGLARLGVSTGFLAKVSNDAFGDFVLDYLKREGVDTSHISRCQEGENLGLAFTEIRSETESSLLMYRNGVADLKLRPEDVEEAYIAQSRFLLVSGTALSASPSREAALKAMLLARKHGVKLVFDIDYRPQIWKSREEVSLYYGIAAAQADVLLGSREEFDLTEALLQPGMGDAESAAYWFTKSASLLVIKHGKEGSVAYGKTGEAYRVKPFHVKLVKGFGGGDGYAAALLSGLLRGLPLSDCLELGSAEAAMLVAAHACSDCMPTLPELQAFANKGIREYGHAVEPIKKEG